MWLVDHDKDKGNPSTADRSHQLALTHLRQHTSPNVFTPTSNYQGCNLQGVVSSDYLNNHGLASWGHYSIQQQRVYPVVGLGTLSYDTWGNLSLHFFLIETLKRFVDHPRHLPWDPQGRGGWDGCTPSLVEWCLPEPILRWSVVGPYDPRGWMAPGCWSDKDKQHFSIVVVAHGGPQLESSQQSSTPGNASDQAWNHHRV